MQVDERPLNPELRLTAHHVSGRYRLDGLLGRGGAADVYEALDLRLRRAVAVKMFRPADTRRPVERCEEQCDEEGRLLARMQHPGLVTLYDSGHDEGRPYLVMQLVRGTTLRRRLAGATLTPAETCRMGATLASALTHVHARGVVHRDVKPSNILLDRADAPHLADFGISRRLDAAAGPEPVPDADADADTGGRLLGTASYMAPEQALGRQTGPAADVYSLGLVLLEALKGEAEYGGAPLEAALAHLERPPVVPPDLPAELAGLLTAMTAQAPTARPDARTCARALADPRIAASPAHHASAPRGPGRIRKHAGVPGRARAVAATVATLGLTLTGSWGSAPAGGDAAASRSAGRPVVDDRPGAVEHPRTTAPAPAAPHRGEPHAHA
ncbi:serine/threonine-protein kinase [Streptomyces sp. NPDC101158]|uniref:serine/threonine-protein kinase n=1 Tax=Streptomyces sp. NPDC101158 TaxID=3366117 RepID=UPI00380CBE1E